jgi:hypothetical protein
MDFREIKWGVVEWINMAQDRHQWRALVNTVMNLRVPQRLGNSWVADLLAASQEPLSSMMLTSTCIFMHPVEQDSLVCADTSVKS